MFSTKVKNSILGLNEAIGEVEQGPETLEDTREEFHMLEGHALEAVATAHEITATAVATREEAERLQHQADHLHAIKEALLVHEKTLYSLEIALQTTTETIAAANINHGELESLWEDLDSLFKRFDTAITFIENQETVVSEAAEEANKWA